MFHAWLSPTRLKIVNLNNKLCSADLWHEEKSVTDSSFQVEGSKPLITKNKYNNQNANNLQSIPCRENIWKFFLCIFCSKSLDLKKSHAILKNKIVKSLSCRIILSSSIYRGSIM